MLIAMTDEERKGRRAIEAGPTSKTVGQNLAKLRKRRGFTTRQLSSALAQVARSIPASGITRMELGERHVTADELVALAAVLDVSPNALLLPASASSDAVALTSAVAVPWLDAWRWATGEAPLPDPDRDDSVVELGYNSRKGRFHRENRPHEPKEEYNLLRLQTDHPEEFAAVSRAVDAMTQAGVTPAAISGYVRFCMRRRDPRFVPDTQEWQKTSARALSLAADQLEELSDGPEKAELEDLIRSFKAGEEGDGEGTDSAGNAG